ncbi:MAG: hypothetical protein FWH21_00505, partial [Kiritimatiellaeota bacterium]|nr:hypothetical protein [Kiritimatiellota bacterium]
VKAENWWRKSAEQGHALSQYDLGQCYEKGWGVERNMALAAEWYTKAAAQGNEYAIKRLNELKGE